MNTPVTRELVRAELEKRVDWARTHGHLEDAAVWELLCDRPDEGLETLRSLVGGASRIRPHWAAVAGDWRRAEEEARLALAEPTERLVAGYAAYLNGLYGLVAGLPDVAAAALDELQAHVARKGSRSAYPRGARQIVEGLVTASQELVSAGLDEHLTWHLRRARARSDIFNSARAMISVEALFVLLVAHRRGLAPIVAARYRRVSVPLLVLHVHEWAGQPLPRALPASVDVDLVAGPWLRAHGLALAAPPPGERPRATRPARRRRLHADADEDAVRATLSERVEARRGSPWQLASWRLMLGDAAAAGNELAAAAGDAERRSRESTSESPTRRMLLRRERALPNSNYLREHFALALVLRDDRALARTGDLLRRWDATLRLEQPYSHAHGYLDLIRHLIGGDVRPPSRADAEQVGGPLRNLSLASVGLVERDPALVERGVRGLLEEHVALLERKTSPPAPICAPAAEVVAAAGRLGVHVAVEVETREYEVPVVLDPRTGVAGRLRCDLLGTPIWPTAGDRR